MVCGCPTELRGETEEDVLGKASDHARMAHGTRHLDDQLVQRIRAAITTR
jgi:predicted small metal-binding protein